MKTKFTILLFFLIGGFYCSAQNQKKIDSLMVVGKKMTLDSNKVKNRLKISELYRGVNNTKAEEFALEAIQLGRKIKWVAHYPNLYLNLSKVHNVLSNYSNAIEMRNKYHWE